jgi:beta-lactam-binding protein with PASTA domain
MRRPLVYVAIILAFFVIGVLIANFLVMPLLVGRGEEVTVPNICDMSLDEAIEELKIVGLEGVVVERRYDNIIEEGSVIVQEPLPNARVKKGRIINLTVSLGFEIIRVPDLVGMNHEQGVSILKRLGLAVAKTDSAFSDSLELGRIISTIPDAGTEVKKGEQINMILSKGIVQRMPNLVGLQLSQAQLILEKMGLIVGRIEEVQGSGQKGTIILQNPEPRSIVDRGDSVSIMVIK